MITNTNNDGNQTTHCHSIAVGAKALAAGAAVLLTAQGIASAADTLQARDSLAAPAVAATPTTQRVTYQHVEIEGQQIFYREAGPKKAPTVLLLHGFPTSSHMYRNLIPRLADRYHVIAPDMPGFGQSSAPSVDEFEYTFDHIASIMNQLTEKVGVEKYSVYLMDYGAPVGFRMAAKHPEKSNR